MKLLGLEDRPGTAAEFMEKLSEDIRSEIEFGKSKGREAQIARSWRMFKRYHKSASAFHHFYHQPGNSHQAAVPGHAIHDFECPNCRSVQIKSFSLKQGKPSPEHAALRYCSWHRADAAL
jgi:hypothetical protein